MPFKHWVRPHGEHGLQSDHPDGRHFWYRPLAQHGQHKVPELASSSALSTRFAPRTNADATASSYSPSRTVSLFTSLSECESDRTRAQALFERTIRPILIEDARVELFLRLIQRVSLEREFRCSVTLLTYKTLPCEHMNAPHDVSKCMYYHSESDYRRSPLLGYYPELCPVGGFGLCKDGLSCGFSHNACELLHHPANHKAAHNFELLASELTGENGVQMEAMESSLISFFLQLCYRMTEPCRAGLVARLQPHLIQVHQRRSEYDAFISLGQFRDPSGLGMTD